MISALVEKAASELFEFLGMFDFTDMPKVERFRVESGCVIEKSKVTNRVTAFDTTRWNSDSLGTG